MLKLLHYLHWNKKINFPTPGLYNSLHHTDEFVWIKVLGFPLTRKQKGARRQHEKLKSFGDAVAEKR